MIELLKTLLGRSYLKHFKFESSPLTSFLILKCPKCQTNKFEIYLQGKRARYSCHGYNWLSPIF